jgi:putative intracellular protease/amidase
MRKSLIGSIALCSVALAAASFGGWLMSLPAAPAVVSASAVPAEETAAALEALKPPKRPRPLVAIVGVNEGTEVTDYLMPFGILRRADVADVVALGTKPGPMTLIPALTVEPQATTAEFDAGHPRGADYVIVPKMHRDDDPIVVQWIEDQATKGAIVVGVCAGAKVVASARLLDGKRATTHWYFVDELRDEHPVRYVADRRFVVDGAVATTTGITASMPMALTLVEAIAGSEKARSVARDLGVTHWDARHASQAFRLTRPFALTAMANKLAFWNREDLGIRLTPGVDEVSLALVADAWSRTYRSRALTFASNAGAKESRNGIRILPDEVAASWPAERLLPALDDRAPAKAFDQVLGEIGRRYGSRTSDLVAMQLEYADGP